MKILGKGDYSIELSFYINEKWHKKVFCKKTLKGAYLLARVLQRNYNGLLYYFDLYDHKQGKVRWWYHGETDATKWCDKHFLRLGQFNCITNYKSLARG